MINSEEFNGVHLKELRLNAGMTQKYLATKSGLSERTIRNLETSGRTIKRAHRLTLSTVFKN